MLNRKTSAEFGETVYSKAARIKELCDRMRRLSVVKDGAQIFVYGLGRSNVVPKNCTNIVLVFGKRKFSATVTICENVLKSA